MFKRRKLKIGNFIDKLFKGSCVGFIKCTFALESKIIMFSVEEIMATKFNLKDSYFDEYEEMLSDESSSEDDQNVTNSDILNSPLNPGEMV